MSLYNYVDTPNTNLLCCICRAPFTEPVTTVTCQHTFCRECITRALVHAPQCPVDRSPLSEEDLGPVNPIVRSLVDELVVECVYKEEGCQRRVQRQLLAAHLRDECEYSESGAVRSEAAKGKSKAVEGSDNEESSNEPQPSEPSESDKTSKPLAESTSSTPETNPPPSQRISRLTEQNVLLRHRVDTLEGAVQFLRKEIAMVRTVLSPWMQNCASMGQPSTQFAPRRVSPTRNAASPQASSSTQPPPPHNPNPSTLGESSSAHPTEPPEDSLHAPSDDRPIDNNDLASYFPAEDEVRVRRTAEHPASAPIPEYAPTQRQPRPPGVGHMHHHSLSSVSGVVPPPSEVHSPMQVGLGMGGFYGSPYASMGMYGSILSPPAAPPQYQQPPSQPLAVQVPELDVSTPSLSTTLQGLHSGIVALASSIEDTHKKSDMALALMGGGGTGGAVPGGGVVGEVLRLGEEVMGVRATVQGLRMQMHGLMMGNIGAGGGGLNIQGAFGAGRQGQAMSTGSGGPPEEGGAEGYVLPSPIQQGLQSQRMFYPVAPGITKL